MSRPVKKPSAASKYMVDICLGSTQTDKVIALLYAQFGSVPVADRAPLQVEYARIHDRICQAADAANPPRLPAAWRARGYAGALEDAVVGEPS